MLSPRRSARGFSWSTTSRRGFAPSTKLGYEYFVPAKRLPEGRGFAGGVLPRQESPGQRPERHESDVHLLTEGDQVEFLHLCHRVGRKGVLTEEVVLGAQRH